MIFLFALTEIQDEEIIGGKQEALFAGTHVIDVQRVGRCPAWREKIEPPAVGAELLAFKIAELTLGAAAATFQQGPVVAAVHVDAP